MFRKPPVPLGKEPGNEVVLTLSYAVCWSFSREGETRNPQPLWCFCFSLEDWAGVVSEQGKNEQQKGAESTDLMMAVKEKTDQFRVGLHFWWIGRLFILQGFS